MALRKKDAKKKEATPDLWSLLEARDYSGAITVIEFERKIFSDKKQASGWRAGAGGEYEWVEGGSSSLTAEEARQDEERIMWLAYAAFHLGKYQQALDAYQSLLDKGSQDQMLHVYMACCLERLGWHTEAEERAQQARPACHLDARDSVAASLASPRASVACKTTSRPSCPLSSISPLPPLRSRPSPPAATPPIPPTPFASLALSCPSPLALPSFSQRARASARGTQGPACPLQNRVLFHLGHRLNDENKLMMHHQKLADTTLDQLSLASIHFLRNHYQVSARPPRGLT